MVALTRKQSEFVDNTFDMLGRTMGAHTFALYAVDDDHNLHDFHCAGIPGDFFRIYTSEMHLLDPLHVRRVATQASRVVRMDQAGDYTPSHEIAEYARFMRRYDFVDYIDILFRLDGKIRAGLSVIWNGNDPPPADPVFQLAADLQPYMEFLLWNEAGFGKPGPMQQAIETFHLTARESEVVKLLCAGRTNADIAECLGIRLSTVKTHLLKIFEKTSVETRSGVVARMSSLF